MRDSDPRVSPIPPPGHHAASEGPSGAPRMRDAQDDDSHIAIGRGRDAALEAELAQPRALQRKAEEWARRHDDRVAQLQRELWADSGDVGRDHQLLVHLAAHEAALAERLAHVQVQLLERASLVVDNAALALKVAKTLREMTAVSGAIGRRVESLLGTASVIRAQRALTAKRPSLRVA